MTATPGKPDVVVAEAAWKPTEKWKSIVGFDQSPFVRHCEINYSVRFYYTTNFVKMVLLIDLHSNVLDDVIGNYDVEMVVGEGQTGAIDELESIPKLLDSIVHDIHAINF